MTITDPLASTVADPTPAMLERAEAWEALAQRAVTLWQALPVAGQNAAFSLGYMIQARAWLDGWDHPDVAAYLTRLYALANPDGGYGLNRIYDAHGNGTNNPANTTYLVTITDHVGTTFINGYLAGKVSAARVQKFIDLILAAPRIDNADGRMVAYSMNAQDAQTGLGVHNVNAGAAVFLMRAGAAGFAVPWWLVQGIIKRTMAAYNATTRFWPYRDNMAPAPQDNDHNSYTAESVYELAPAVGYSAAWKAMTTAPDSHPNTPITYARLTGLPSMPTARSADGTTTVWCELGDQWIDTVDAWATTNAGEANRLGQVAYYAARASLAALA